MRRAFAITFALCLFGVLVALAELAALDAARADVLFIDLNYSQSEVAAARVAAEARGEKLYVVPGMPEKFQPQFAQIRKESSEASIAKARACGAKGDLDSCTNATARLKSIEARDEELQKQVPKMDESAMLSRELGKLKAQKVNLTSLIISGHHTDKEYYGVLADLDEEEIEKAFLANKPVADNVRSLYLWGCYAATTDDFLKGFKKAFPSVTMMAGFSGQAPSSTRPASGKLLKDLMVREGEFQRNRTREELKGLFDSLADVNKTKASLCIDRETVVSKEGVRSVGDEIQACGHRSREETKHIKTYYCYLRCEPGCVDVPKDDEDRSPLRTAYDYFQETRHCDEVLEARKQKREVTQLMVRRLLFDHEIRQSFMKLNGKYMPALNQLMAELGLPESMRIKDFSKISRADYLEKVYGLERAYNGMSDRIRDPEGHIYDARVLAIGKYVDQFKKLERGECIPLSWLERQPDKDPCGMGAGMKDAIRSSEVEVNRLLSQRLAP